MHYKAYSELLVLENHSCFIIVSGGDFFPFLYLHFFFQCFCDHSYNLYLKIKQFVKIENHCVRLSSSGH